MKRFFLLLLIAVVIIGIVIFFSNPQLLDEVWLWLIGFSGSILGLIRNLWEEIKGIFSDDKEDNKKERAKELKEENSVAVTKTQKELEKTQTQLKKAELDLQNFKAELEKNKQNFKEEIPYEGTTLNLVRFQYDTDTTLGLLYIKDKFLAYTLEDTYRVEKKFGETRIPKGVYEIKFREILTDLTKSYRGRRRLKHFFTYHLELQNVPNYEDIYIHIGNDHGDTNGCILIADGIQGNNIEKSIIYSENAFIRFYKMMKALLEGGSKVRIRIFDEDWINQLKPTYINA